MSIKTYVCGMESLMMAIKEIANNQNWRQMKDTSSLLKFQNLAIVTVK